MTIAVKIKTVWPHNLLCLKEYIPMICRYLKMFAFAKMSSFAIEKCFSTKEKSIQKYEKSSITSDCLDVMTRGCQVNFQETLENYLFIKLNIILEDKRFLIRVHKLPSRTLIFHLPSPTFSM